MDDDTAIERRLARAQAAVREAAEAQGERRRAVMAALAAGWSKYRIAAVLDVGSTTVDAIIKSARRHGDEPPAQ